MARFAGIPVYDASVTATAELLRTGSIVVQSVEIENPNTVQVYLQLFDAAAATDVTLGSTTPVDTRMIPEGSGGGFNTSRLIDIPKRFTLGCVYAITTTRSGSTAPSTACPCNFTIQ
jgi:hypothetical protein